MRYLKATFVCIHLASWALMYAARYNSNLVCNSRMRLILDFLGCSLNYQISDPIRSDYEGLDLVMGNTQTG